MTASAGVDVGAAGVGAVAVAVAAAGLRLPAGPANLSVVARDRLPLTSPPSSWRALCHFRGRQDSVGVIASYCTV